MELWGFIETPIQKFQEIPTPSKKNSYRRQEKSIRSLHKIPLMPYSRFFFRKSNEKEINDSYDKRFDEELQYNGY